MGLFSFINKNKSLPQQIKSNYTVDIHSHVIPHIDDGAISTEESNQMIGFMMQNGIRKIIATPHISLDFPKNTSERITSHFERFKAKLLKAAIDIGVDVAAEYMIDDGFRTLFEKGDLLTFGNKFLLVELSGFSQHPDFSALLFELQSSGYHIVLAHPERYTFFHDDLPAYKALKDREVFFQMNLLSLTDIYSSEVNKAAKWLIENQMVDFIGSDMHHQSQFAFYKKAFAGKLFEKLTRTNAIKNNDFLD